jgi:acetyl esterase/lipase
MSYPPQTNSQYPPPANSQYSPDNLALPAFLVGADISDAKTRIIQSRELSNDVCKIVGTQPCFVEDTRYLDGEFVLGSGMTSGVDMPLILYLHGGANSALSSKSHRAITSRLSSECRALVYALDYRLSPESIFPSALEDVLAAYLALANGEYAYGSSINGYTHTPGRRIFIAGDRYVSSTY